MAFRQAALHPALVTKDKPLDHGPIDFPTPTQEGNAQLDEAVDALASALDGLSVEKARKCDLCTEPLPQDVVGQHCISCRNRIQMATRFQGLSMSTKTARLLELLEQIAAEDVDRPKKTIVFSQVRPGLLLSQKNS